MMITYRHLLDHIARINKYTVNPLSSLTNNHTPSYTQHTENTHKHIGTGTQP